MLIYKIFRAAEWRALQTEGTTLGAPIDVADGYVHFSTAMQAPATAAKHFAGEDDLVLLALDSDTMGDDLQWEKSRGDQVFPHLYRALTLNEVLWDRPLPLGPKGHIFQAKMA